MLVSNKYYRTFLVVALSSSVSIGALAQDRGGRGERAGGAVKPAPQRGAPPQRQVAPRAPVRQAPSPQRQVVPSRDRNPPSRVSTPAPERKPAPVVTQPGRDRVVTMPSQPRPPSRERTIATPGRDRVVTGPKQPGRDRVVNPAPGRDRTVTTPGRDRVVTRPSQPARKPAPVVNHRPSRRDFNHREVRINNRPMIERTRFDRRHNNHIVRHYKPHRWGHQHLHVYVHHYQYRPFFWTRFFVRFTTPWHYNWRWVSAPWYRYWSWYYTPYPVYHSPSYWVTDYVLSDMLAEQYSEGYRDGFRDGVNYTSQGYGSITGNIKEQIRAQVEQTANAYQSNMSVQLEQVLRDPNYLFAVDVQMSVLTSNNTICELSGGDLLKASKEVYEGDRSAEMVVVTSKGGNCMAGTIVQVSIEDLQEMLNTFSEKVDAGLNEMQKLNVL